MGNSKKRKTSKIEKSKKNRIKSWLKDNKIYFETIMTCSLTIMGIIISSVSLSFQHTSNELQEKQSLIETQLNLPVFNVSKSRYEENIIDGISIPAGTEINIVNNGGNISNGYLHADAKIEIKFYDKEYNNQGAVVINKMQQFLKGYSYYDAKTKSFTIKKSSNSERVGLSYFLENQLHNEYKNYNFIVLIADYINIRYDDFQNQSHDEWYILIGGELSKKSPIEFDEQKILEVDSMTNEEVYLEVKEMLDDLLCIDR